MGIINVETMLQNHIHVYYITCTLYMYMHVCIFYMCTIGLTYCKCMYMYSMCTCTLTVPGSWVEVGAFVLEVTSSFTATGGLDVDSTNGLCL